MTAEVGNSVQNGHVISRIYRAFPISPAVASGEAEHVSPASLPRTRRISSPGGRACTVGWPGWKWRTLKVTSQGQPSRTAATRIGRSFGSASPAKGARSAGSGSGPRAGSG